MVGCCLLLSTALFVVACHPEIVDDGALVLPAASPCFIDLRPQHGSRCRQRRGPVGGHETVAEDQLVLQC